MIMLSSKFEKALDIEGNLIIEGYANTTTVDRVGDVIIEDAWRSLGALDNYLKNPIILAFHNHSKPIGRMVEHQVTPNGLYIKAEISKAAGDIHALISDGILSTFSVGFSVKDATYDSTADIFVIKALELYEISVVSVPANADSTFRLSKQLGEDISQYIESLEEDEEPSDDDIIEMQDDLIKDLQQKIEVLQTELNTEKNVTVEVGQTGAEKLELDLVE